MQEEGAQKALQYTEATVKTSGRLTLKAMGKVLDELVHHKRNTVRRTEIKHQYANEKIARASGGTIQSKHFDALKPDATASQVFGAATSEEFLSKEKDSALLDINQYATLAKEKGVYFNVQPLFNEKTGDHIGDNLTFRAKDERAFADLQKEFEKMVVEHPEKLKTSKQGQKLADRIDKAERRAQRHAMKVGKTRSTPEFSKSKSL